MRTGLNESEPQLRFAFAFARHVRNGSSFQGENLVLQLASSEWWRQTQLWVVVGGLAMFWTIESIWPRKGPGRFRARLAHTGSNLGIWVLGAIFLSLLAGNSYSAVLSWLGLSGIGLLHFVSLPVWLDLLVAFLLLDFADYAYHRLSHRARWLWLLHSVHHSDTDVDVSTNLRQHPVHLLTTLMWKIVAFAAVGAPLELAMARETLVILIAHLHHTAIGWPAWVERTFGRVFISPRAHWVHHSPADGETDANFGTTLVLWDRLCATYVEPTRPGPGRFGLNALSEKRWQTPLGMLLTPIRARKLERL